MKSCKLHQGVSWFLQVVAAVILAQTLFFKFSGAEESKFIFTALGVEPWGRIATGLFELIAVALLLTPRLAGFGGLLFGLAVTVFVAGALIVWLRRFQLPFVGESPRGGCPG